MSTDEGDIAADSEGRASVKSNASLVSLMHEPDRLNVSIEQLIYSFLFMDDDNFTISA